MSVETPFPVEGTITPNDHGFSASLPCASAWLTETNNGDYLQQAVDRAARKYGEDVEVNVRFTADKFGDTCGGFELLGPVEGGDDADPEDAGEDADHSGIVLYTEDGDPVQVALMDEDDEYLELTANPERGVYGYENDETRVTAFVEEA